MARDLHLELANFHCRFGDRWVLLDLAEEIVIPAFTTPGFERTYGNTRYFFYEQQVLRLRGADPVIGIAGRLVKDTVLTRNQFFDEKKGLIQDEQSMPSSPSAVFVLLLNDHRLLFLPETSHAPTLSNFQATAQRFLRDSHDRFINARFSERLESHRASPSESDRPTKKSLRDEYPRPDLEVIPIAGEAELREFVESYATLRTAEVVLIETNNEIDNDAFFRKVRESKEAAGSSKTKLTHSNPRGLEKEGIYNQLDAAARQGNSKIRLAGKDSAGDDLIGSNESFRIRIPIREIAEDVSEAARAMYRAYQRTLSAGIVPTQAVSERTRDRIRTLLGRLRGRFRE